MDDNVTRPVRFAICGALPHIVQAALHRLANEGLCELVDDDAQVRSPQAIHLWTDRPATRRGRDVIVYKGRPPRWALDWLQQPGTALLRVSDNDEDQYRLLRQLAGQSSRQPESAAPV